MAGKALEVRHAIQTWYNLHIDEKSLRVSCDEVIKVPLDLRLIGPEYKYMSPCVVITTEYIPILETIKIVFETNEGFTIEPVEVVSVSHVGNVYILTLPPKTTGLKNVKVFGVMRGEPFNLQTDLFFDIMYPPYYYEGAALENVAITVYAYEGAIIDLSTQLEALTTRVEALEQKRKQVGV